MFYKGVSGKMTTETADEDDNFGTEQSHKVKILFDYYYYLSNRVHCSLKHDYFYLS